MGKGPWARTLELIGGGAEAIAASTKAAAAARELAAAQKIITRAASGQTVDAVALREARELVAARIAASTPPVPPVAAPVPPAAAPVPPAAAPVPPAAAAPVPAAPAPAGSTGSLTPGTPEASSWGATLWKNTKRVFFWGTVAGTLGTGIYHRDTIGEAVNGVRDLHTRATQGNPPGDPGSAERRAWEERQRHGREIQREQEVTAPQVARDGLNERNTTIPTAVTPVRPVMQLGRTTVCTSEWKAEVTATPRGTERDITVDYRRNIENQTGPVTFKDNLERVVVPTQVDGQQQYKFTVGADVTQITASIPTEQRTLRDTIKLDGPLATNLAPDRDRAATIAIPPRCTPRP